MSKAVKTVIGVAAAIAIPFVAPTIASTIGTSLGISAATFGMSATVGSVLGSAAVGAVLGGTTQAALGGDVGRGALMGAIGGGIQGYTSMPATAGGTAGGTAAIPSPVTTQPMPVSYDLGAGGAGLQVPSTFGGTQAGLSGAGGATGFTGVDYSLASGAQFPTTGLNPASAGAGTFGSSFAPTITPSTVAQSGLLYSGGSMPTVAGLSGVGGLTAEGMAALGAMGSAGAELGAGTTGFTSATKPMTFTEALKQVPGEIAAKFKDPKALADLTLRAAGNIAGSIIAGDGLSNEERALLDAQTQELRTLQQTNAGLFAQRLEQAQNLMGESKYFDPEYFGLQRARRAQTAAAQAKRAGLRGLEGAQRAAEARRFDLATARDVGSAFDQGYMQGVSGRLATMQAGMSMMPTGFPSSMGDYSNLRQAYSDAETRAGQRASNFGKMYGSLLGIPESQSRDKAKEPA